MLELLGLAKRGVINPIISKRYKLDDANVALEDLKARKILGRAVINP
jgi:propanol-preferring alcohol dehydrogenase